MSGPALIRAAQYLRMSSEHQRYSFEVQSSAIAAYANRHGYEICCTFDDAARSGLHLRGRAGLQALLSEVLRPDRAFEAILVFDVSRWGRFQDLDQGAHYEFICRAAGVRVIYCAEPFEDDGTAQSALIKQLKRLMAAEYSRELSVKTKAAHLQQAKLGHRQGGPLVYGLLRVLVDSGGRPLQILERGKSKAQRDHYVILAHGPPEEVRVLRGIFRRFALDGWNASQIARDLNRKGVPYIGERRWDPDNITRLLRHELMQGDYVFNRSSQLLKGPPVENPPSEWVRTPVFDPLVPKALFIRAQAKLRARARPRHTRAEMLVRTEKVLLREGRLSASIIRDAASAPSLGSITKHFGGLPQLYAALGYAPRHRKPAKRTFDRDAALQALRIAYAREGFLTGASVKADPELFDPATYRKHFGSLTAAYRLAGLPHTRSQLLTAAKKRQSSANPAQT